MWIFTCSSTIVSQVALSSTGMMCVCVCVCVCVRARACVCVFGWLAWLDLVWFCAQSPYIALVGLELAIQTSLALNLQ